MLLCVTGAFPQLPAEVSFSFNEEGKFFTTDNKNYTVIQKPGMKAAELYDKFMYYIKVCNFENDENIYGKKYNVKYLENEKISVVTVLVNAYDENVMGINFDKHLTCKFMFQFRDGKIRIDAPIIKNIITDHPIKKGSEASISKSSFREVIRPFYKDGEVKESKERLYKGINNAVNNELNRIITKSFEPKVQEKW